MNNRPSTSPASKIEITARCDSFAIARASRSNRPDASDPRASSGCTTLMATWRSCCGSRADHTTPIAPAPSRDQLVATERARRGRLGLVVDPTHRAGYTRCVHILVDVAADRLRAELIELLERAGHTIERGTPAPHKQFDVVMVGTPEVAERLRRVRPFDAIIVISKLDDVPARVRALEVGADDAFDAGFPPSQMMARIGAAGRRAATAPRPTEHHAIDGCVVDLTAATACRDGVTTELTAREVEIVRWLARHAGQIVSRADLLQHVWRVAAGNTTRAVDVAIAGLRAKLERDPENPVITTVRGLGYRWG